MTDDAIIAAFTFGLSGFIFGWLAGRRDLVRTKVDTYIGQVNTLLSILAVAHGDGWRIRTSIRELGQSNVQKQISVHFRGGKSDDDPLDVVLEAKPRR